MPASGLVVRHVTFSGKKLERVPEGRAKHLEAVAATSGRARQVHDQRRAASACDAARQQRVWRFSGGVGTDRFCDSRGNPIDDRCSRLRGDIARREPCSTCRENDAGLAAEVHERIGDLVRVVVNDSPSDLEAFPLQ